MSLFTKLFKLPAALTPKLGRWYINYTPQIVHIKIDQANEDHCGCCSLNEIVCSPVKIVEDSYLEPFVM